MYTHPEFHHIDADIKAEELTNVQIMNILNPATEEYKDYINFIYDSSSKLALLFLGKRLIYVSLLFCSAFEWCEGSEEWFAAERR
jgi:hypothetical protein